MPLKPSRNGSWIRRIAYGSHGKRFFHLWKPLWAPDVRVHQQCDCNEYISIRNRVQQVIPTVAPVALELMKCIARAIGDQIRPVVPLDGSWVTRYAGRKRANYEKAQRSLAVQPLHRKDRTVRAFIKAEKLPDEPKDPRMIQFRGPRFNCVFGDYTRALEAVFYRIRGTGRLRNWLPRDRLFAKGLNLRDRARVIANKMRFGTCYSLDCSRFDAHVSQDHLRLGHIVYLRAFNNDPVLRRLLGWQLNNNCYTKHWHYNSVGGRMSGDMDTALGNCVLMLILVAAAMRMLRAAPTSWTVFVDGDDCLLFTRLDVSRLPELFLLMGHELKIEQSTNNLFTVQHCQCRPVMTSRGLIMVANPLRVVSRTLAGCQHWHDSRFWQPYLGLLGYCTLALASGVPVLQAFAQMLLRWSSGRMPRRLELIDDGILFKSLIELRTFEPVCTPITATARATFAEAWGMEPDEQRFYELEFSKAPPPWTL